MDWDEMLTLPLFDRHSLGDCLTCCPGPVGLIPLPFGLSYCRPLYLQLCSSFYQLPSRSFSTSVNLIFLSAIAISSVQILTFRKIFLFLCHTKIYNVYLTKQLNVTIKTYLIMIPLFECLNQHPARSCLNILILPVCSRWQFLKRALNPIWIQTARQAGFRGSPGTHPTKCCCWFQGDVLHTKLPKELNMN